MNALEKSAWTELVVVALSLSAVAVCLPFMGHRATGWFGLLGMLPAGMFFLRRRGDEVLVDERDTEIQRLATAWGVQAAWIVSLLPLIGLSLWYGDAQGSVPVRYLTWILWLQFAALYGAKSLVTIISYRRQGHAA